MNKFLMGTTALVAASAFTAPAFAAERLQLQIRGYNTSGLSYTDADYEEGYTFFDDDGSVWDSDSYSPSNDTNEINFGSSSEIHFIGSTTLDNGLEVTFHAELELETDSAAAPNYWYEEADTIDEVYIQFDGGFGRVQFGQQDGVMDQMAVTAPSTFMAIRTTTLKIVRWIRLPRSSVAAIQSIQLAISLATARRSSTSRRP